MKDSTKIYIKNETQRELKIGKVMVITTNFID